MMKIGALLLCLIPSVLWSQDWNPRTTLVPASKYVTFDLVRQECAFSSALVRSRRSLCRVDCSDRGNGFYSGSGNYLGSGRVITAWHVIRDGDRNRIFVNIGGKRYRAKGYVKNKNADQVVLKLDGSPNTDVAVLAKQAPKQGDIVHGFGMVTPTWSGRLVNYGSKGGTPPPAESADYRGTVGTQGDSGAGIFNQSGEYVGTYWGTSGNEGTAVRYQETADFLKRSGVLDELNGTQLTGTSNCANGQCELQFPQQPKPDYCPNGCQSGCQCGCTTGGAVIQGPIGPPGPPGADSTVPGPPGRPGRDATDEQIAKGIVAYMKLNPPKNGIDGLPGIPGKQGPPGAEPSDDRLRELIDEQLAAASPAILQPAFFDKDGKLRPTGDRIELRHGKVALLPPARIEVLPAFGEPSQTQAVNGGKPGVIDLRRLQAQ